MWITWSSIRYSDRVGHASAITGLIIALGLTDGGSSNGRSIRVAVGRT